MAAHRKGEILMKLLEKMDDGAAILLVIVAAWLLGALIAPVR